MQVNPFSIPRGQFLLPLFVGVDNPHWSSESIRGRGGYFRVQIAQERGALRREHHWHDARQRSPRKSVRDGQAEIAWIGFVHLTYANCKSEGPDLVFNYRMLFSGNNNTK